MAVEAMRGFVAGRLARDKLSNVTAKSKKQ